MRCIREQCRSLKVGPNAILDAFRCLVQLLAAWSWGWGLLCFICQIYTSVLDTQCHTSCIRCLCFSCWIPTLDEQVSTGLRPLCKKAVTVLNSGQKYWWSQSFRYYSLSGTKRACCRCCWVAVILLFSICPCIQLLVANSYLSMVALYGICLIWPIYGVPIQKWQELRWRWEGGGCGLLSWLWKCQFWMQPVYPQSSESYRMPSPAERC